MNKKSMAFWFFIEIIAGIVAALVLTWAAVSYAEGTIFVKTKIARDIALEVNTLYAVPGEVYLKYPQNLSIYRVEFDDDKDLVWVYEEGDILKPSYPYSGKRIEYYSKDFKVDFLEFYKDKDGIKFEE